MTPLDAGLLRRDAPDDRLERVEGGEVAARCSLWWVRVPELAGERLGAIGHFAAGTESAALAVLEEACRALRARGCTLAIGPMDGNTWRRYRLLTERGDAPPFFLEIDNPDEYPAWFRAAGFGPIAGYRSTVDPALDEPYPRYARARERLDRLGVTIRPIDPARLEAELKLAYQVARSAFRNAFLYMPLEEREFVELHQGMEPVVREGLSALAFHGEDPVGLILAVPDLLQRRRGAPETDYLIKTLAIAPGRAYAGLGTVLMAHTRAIASTKGLSRAIHALMHDQNVSTAVCAGHTRLLRRYTLFSKRLA
ncbi:MAG: N-acetyltransferase [Elusimicrobia bacterium]|nr:N-acetyltransferase [Elusimicrobiota bacterium]